MLVMMTQAPDWQLDEVAQASDRPTFNTAAVEQQTGLRPATFRAWERRYGFPKPRRLPGNRRLYSDRDVAAIRWLHRRTSEGLAISHAVDLLRERLSGASAIAAPEGGGRPPAALAEQLAGALLRFDSSGAGAVLTEAFAMYPLEQVCLHVVEPTLVRVGEGWHQGEVSVAAEHFASGFLRRKLFALFNVFETGRGRGLIFTGCAPDQWHEVGILIVSIFLARRGFRVDYLGANLAIEGLAETLRAQRPDVLCISATTEEGVDGLLQIAQVIESLPEPRPLLAYGGQAFADPARRTEIPGSYLGPDAASAAAAIEELLDNRV